MPKKFNIREWILSVKYWSLLFIPHISICFIFLIYILIGASIIQEIETGQRETSSSLNNFSRKHLISKIVANRQTLDIEQFTKYLYDDLYKYEEEIKQKQYHDKDNSSWSFSQSLFLIVTTLTTIGSNQFIPTTALGKLFLMVYTGFGIPLALVFLIDLSYMTKRLISYISFIIFYFYSSKRLHYFRRLTFIRLIEERLEIFVEYDEPEEEEESHLKEASSKTQRYISDFLNTLKNLKQDNNLTLTQITITLFIYLIMGSYFILPPSKSFLDSFYLCFTTIFTVNLSKQVNQDNNLVLISMYIIFGLGVILLFVNTIKLRLEIFLINMGKMVVKNLLEFSQQIGSHDLRTDDILTDNEFNPYTITESIFSRHQYLTGIPPLEQQANARPVGVAEPLRRLSSDLIRVLKNSENNDEKKVNKSVQVTTLIRRCNRCAESPVPVLSSRKHSVMSNSSSSSITDNSSSCEEDDFVTYSQPNIERVRKRRATLVAKTIINQMATQPRTAAIEEYISPLSLSSKQRHRSGTGSSGPIRCSVKVSRSPSLESSRKFDSTQKEFSEISKQISSLLKSHDDENLL